MSSRKQTTVAEKKPYCKVCHDAGKSESVYTSHYVKTSLGPNAKIACPTLLALECKYCFQAGHTVKYCTVIKKNEKAKRTEEFSKNKGEEKNTAQKTNTMSKNAFAMLSDDDEEEGEQQQEQEKGQPMMTLEEFPQLNPGKMTTMSFGNAAVMSFAKIASIGHTKKEQEKPIKCEKIQEPERTSAATIHVVVPEPKLFASQLNWAMSDSDSDNESDFDFESDTDF